MIKRFTTRDPDFTQQLAALLAYENAQDEGIEQAVAAFPDAADIYERNIETLNKLGVAGWKKLFEA